MFVKQFKINFDEIVALWFAFEWTFQISWKKNAEVLLKSQNLIYGNLPIWKVLRLEDLFQSRGIKVARIKTRELKIFIFFLPALETLPAHCWNKGILLKGLSLFEVWCKIHNISREVARQLTTVVTSPAEKVAP